MCFSVISASSFENVKNKWLPELRHHAPHVPILLVGTKSDLRRDAAMAQQLAAKGMTFVGIDKAEQLAREIGAVKYMECSAMTQDGLKDAFDEAIRAALAPRREQRKKKFFDKCEIM